MGKPRISIPTKNGHLSSLDPPSALTGSGADLWREVQASYAVTDPGGQMLLLQACEALNRAEGCAKQIAADGLLITSRFGVIKDNPLLKHELNNRALCCRLLTQLGINVEAIKPMGRPGNEVGVRFHDLPRD